MRKQSVLSRGFPLLAVLLAALPAWGQRIRFPQTTTSTVTAYQGSERGTEPLAPVPSNTGSTPGGASSTTLGQPTFDPYATSPDVASTPPSLVGPPGSSAPGTYPATPYWQSPTCPPSSPQPSSVYPSTPYPATTHPQQPPVLFPNGAGVPFNWPQPQAGPYLRLFQDVRFRYTWLSGDDSSDEMQSHDVEVATTVNFPNFLYSGQPLHVSPVFIFHFWDGPDRSPTFGTELPSRVYSVFGQLRWEPKITPQFGGELDASLGVFSDFDGFTTDSLRIQGTGLFVLALTPTVSIKGGVTYLDRVDLKMLPAGGILWRPNPQTYFDIFFPKPKLSQYLTTVGNTDIWWYINGEIGGGSWTIVRPESNGDRRVDINDIRVGGGLEWTRQSGLKGFAEVAYVFDRELVFASGPIESHSLDDTIMVRGGLAY